MIILNKSLNQIVLFAREEDDVLLDFGRIMVGGGGEDLFAHSVLSQ